MTSLEELNIDALCVVLSYLPNNDILNLMLTSK